MIAVLGAVALAAAALLALSTARVNATVRTALLLGGAALLALVDPTTAELAAAAVAVAFVVDAVMSRPVPMVTRRAPTVLSRGVPATLEADARARDADTVLVRQPRVPDITIEPAEVDGRATAHLEARIVARRRGHHVLPPVATRVEGPLGLAAWYRSTAESSELLVYPDLPAAQRLALAVRQGRFRDPGRRSRGPLGLGTDFESIRDYLPDDDIRQVNWRATARLGRPMSNQYRVEQDRDVIGVLDCGRLMAAPVGRQTRLDAAIDALVAVAAVADEVGDRCGVVAFDATVRRRLAPRRAGGDAIVRAVFDLEPVSVDSDYELAFRTVGSAKRALVLVLTDLLDEAAARALVEALPVLARRHVVVVASTTDPDLEHAVRTAPVGPGDVYTAAIALEVLGSRARVGTQLRRAGADVVEAAPQHLATACVAAYLRAKARARL
jgi:uncharacterized protein (DUF58 family)